MSVRHRSACRWAFVCLASAAASAPIASVAEDRASDCGPMAVAGQASACDYLKDRARIDAIDGRNFTPKYEALVIGPSGSPGSDLTANLDASPNHHRALAAIMGPEELRLVSGPSYLGSTVECFFKKAVNFSLADTVAGGLFALYLTRHQDDAGGQAEGPESVEGTGLVIALSRARIRPGPLLRPEPCG